MDLDEDEIFILIDSVDSSDSSGSSSDEDKLVANILDTVNVRPTPVPKIRDYIETVVRHYTEKQFQGTFRMATTTAYNLIEMYEESEYYNPNGEMLQISAETQILSLLWYAGNESTFRSVAERFNLATSSAHAAMNKVMDFLLSIAPNIIKWPETRHEKNNIANEFQQISGISGIIGCIDGCFIDIRTPANKLQSTYINRHDYPSMTLQGICDSRFRFIDCYTGVPSKVHDSRVFQMSYIFPIVHRMENNFHLLGDCAYAVSKNVLSPYRNYGNLSNDKQNFNEKLSMARVKIENAFGFLKARFRQLTRIDFHTAEKDAKFIICCCVMHNLCIEHDDFLDEIDDRSAHYDTNNAPINVNQPLGLLKRDVIALLLP